MRIAYISYEYPPDTASGGIATYVYQASKMMNRRAHHVEVFCGSDKRSGTTVIDGIIVHHINCNRFAFPEKVLGIFRDRIINSPFDILESPEFGGDGYYIKKDFPHIPMVVKLHTPWFLIIELNTFYLSIKYKIRFYLSCIYRLKNKTPYWKPNPKTTYLDYQTTMLADSIHTPSISLGDIVSKRWEINREKIINVPYPFVQNQKLLDIPITLTPQRVTFMGRLETRKGIINLVEAIPYVLEKFPDTKFRFVGKTEMSPFKHETMESYIKNKLAKYIKSLEFYVVTANEIPNMLQDSAVIVLPSIWENFPNVCLESMSAGRAIVASNEGGMKDMLSSPDCGILVNPMDVKEIANSINLLLSDDSLRIKLGNKARDAVIFKYNETVIGELVENQYQKLIK